MGLRYDPVGGGQFKQAVQQIIEAERQPVVKMEARKNLEEQKLKLFQEFKGKFGGFRENLRQFEDFRNFRELKVDLGDGEQFVSVTVDKDVAQTGTFQIEVEELAGRSSIISNSFKDPDEKVLGVGFITAELANGEDVEIYVDEHNSSLRGVANLINKMENYPIQASVVRDQTDPERPWHLILTSKEDGLDDEAHFPQFYFMGGYEDFYINNENDSKNALLKLDGFEIEGASNQIENFLEGVNLHLKQARPGYPITVTIKEDFQKISGKVKGLVDQVNSILKFINDQNRVDESTDTRTTFTGDTALQGVEYRLRNVLHEGFPVGHPDDENFRYVFLTEMGLQFDREGTLKFDENKFNQSLEKDFYGVSQAVTGPWGFAKQLGKLIDGYTKPGSGMLQMRETSLQNKIRKIDDDIASKERRIEQKIGAITQKFARLQSTLANLQRQQSYLAASMPSGGGGDMISQLLGG